MQKRNSLFFAISLSLLNIVIIVSIVLVMSATSFAQSSSAAANITPYSAIVLSIDELITDGTASESPVDLPWPQIELSVQAEKKRLDFVHIFDVNFDDAIDYFASRYRNAEDIMAIKPGLIRYSTATHLKVIGMQSEATHARLTLGLPGLPRHFTLDITPHNKGTKVIYRNGVYTMLYSGIMPARAPFTPIGANPVPFRWN